MTRVLLIWELGDGLGHVSRLVTIAERLRDEGMECLILSRNIEQSGAYVQSRGFPLLQTPIAAVERIQPPERKPVSMGDILGTIGFGAIDRLRPIVLSWQATIEALAPDFVITDYAPSANLALLGGPVPSLVIGDGFTLPPVNLQTFPKFRTQEHLYDEAKLIEVVNRLQAERGRPSVSALPSLFAGTRHAVITLPELDAFGQERETRAIGPIGGYPRPVEDEPVQDYFAYLSAAYQYTGMVLEGLRRSGAKGSVFLRDSTPDMRERVRRAGIEVYETPRDMAEMSKRSAVIIHHGGVGTSEAVLALGRPQMLVPRHAEQWMNADSLGRNGVATAVRGAADLTPEDVAACFGGAKNRQELADRAKSIASILARRPKNALDQLVSICSQLNSG